MAERRTIQFLQSMPPARAQANFSENFDLLGPTNSEQELIARGWAFRNQSSPIGAFGFAGFSHDVNPILPTAHSGKFYLGITDAAAEAIDDSLSVLVELR